MLLLIEIWLIIPNWNVSSLKLNQKGGNIVLALAAKCTDSHLTAWVQILDGPLSSCKSLGKSHNLFIPQQNDDDTLGVVVRR